MAKKKTEEVVEEVEILEDDDFEVDIPVSDEAEIDDGDLEDEEFFEETTDEDEEVSDDDANEEVVVEED